MPPAELAQQVSQPQRARGRFNPSPGANLHTAAAITHRPSQRLVSQLQTVKGPVSHLFVFECEEYATEATVTRAEARDLYPNPDSLTAVDEVLQQEKGWTNGERGAYCPDCEPPEG